MKQILKWARISEREKKVTFLSLSDYKLEALWAVKKMWLFFVVGVTVIILC